MRMRQDGAERHAAGVRHTRSARRQSTEDCMHRDYMRRQRRMICRLSTKMQNFAQVYDNCCLAVNKVCDKNSTNFGINQYCLDDFVVV